ncbi:hypothetical protein H0A36_27770 [Endozoicomonas sp. SM1973]|uniref:Uncharacterized protein n=1 Tax=Spartinivicinus marinus TaxID=2994442 RepID=A0A853IIF8_9GAMM|nr:hypothetical protein [Spartinivicinus marinus]MCX4025093.1 hypothetical protein [Spartinivicinus marinus]NYZ69814.1 hypothetical protein [Spartinivicinus marinus]
MSRVFIGYDYRLKASSPYLGIDSSVCLQPEFIDKPNSKGITPSKTTNGLNLFDELLDVEIPLDTAVLAFDANKQIIQHMASTFGLYHMLEKKNDFLFSAGFKFIGFDVVDLYTQETFLLHVDTTGYSINSYGLIEKESMADDLAKSINDTYKYDSVGVWLKI